MVDAVIGSGREADPGRMLQEARTRLGLSIAEVAEHLNLSARQIIAIEKDDFASLPESTYVRGYLRNYAMLVGVPAEAVLAAYQRRIHPEVLAERLDEASEADLDRSGEAGIHPGLWIGGTVALAVGIGLIVGAQWLGHRRPSATTPVAREVLSVPARGPAPIYSPSVLLPSNVPAPRANIPLVPFGKTSNPAPVRRGSMPASVPSSEKVMSTPAVSAKRQSLPIEVPVHSGPPFLVGPHQYGRIVLTAGRASEVAIRDATQMVLLHEHLPAGQTVTLNGVPPFTVYLSDASGADLRYNGRAVNLGPFLRGKGVRAVVGAGRQ